MYVIKGRCARHALLHIFKIVFKCSKNNLPQWNIFNESANLIDSCDVAFNTYDG